MSPFGCRVQPTIYISKQGFQRRGRSRAARHYSYLPPANQEKRRKKSMPRYVRFQEADPTMRSAIIDILMVAKVDWSLRMRKIERAVKKVVIDFADQFVGFVQVGVKFVDCFQRGGNRLYLHFRQAAVGQWGQEEGNIFVVIHVSNPPDLSVDTFMNSIAVA